MTSLIPLRRDFLAGVVMVLVLAPVIVLGTPPLVDLSAHVLRMYLVAYVPPDDPLWAFYSFEPTFSPNFGFDALFYLFATVLPFRAALMLALLGCFGLLAAGIVALSRSLHGRVSAGAVMACIFVFSWPMQLGFLNFGVSIGLACLGLAFYIRHKTPGGRKIAVLVLLSLLAWAAHVAGWGTLGLMALGVEIARIAQAPTRIREAGRAVLRLMPLAVPAVLTLIWIVVFTKNTGGGAGGGYAINWAQKLTYVITTLQVEWPVLDLAVLGLSGLLAVWFFAGRDVPIALPARLGAVLLLAAFVLLPTGIGTTYFLDRRMLMPLGIMFFTGLGCESSSRRGQFLQNGMIGLAVLYVGAMTLAWLGMAREEAAQKALLEPVPDRSRVLLLEVRGCVPSQFDLWRVPRHPLATLDLLAGTDSFVNGTWDLPDSNGLGVPFARETGWNDIEDAVIRSDQCPPDHWVQRITKVDVQGAAAVLPRGLYDYVWLVMDQSGDVPAGLGEGFERVGQSAKGALYRITR